MIKDVLNIQGNTLELLNEGYELALTTKNKRELLVKLKDDLKDEVPEDEDALLVDTGRLAYEFIEAHNLEFYFESWIIQKNKNEKG